MLLFKVFKVLMMPTDEDEEIYLISPCHLPILNVPILLLTIGLDFFQVWIAELQVCNTFEIDTEIQAVV